ncbi:MAG TPA: endonuclease/exonuclease/phosphatase family protein [Verrucomicrobiae bacterium]
MRDFVLKMIVLMCVGAGVGCATTKQHPAQITVMSYNIHHAEGTDGKLNLERIAKIVQAQNPDLVALQEVDDRADRSGRVDQAAELGRLTGMHHVFGKAMDFQGGGYGQAILSRWPIKAQQVHQLPQRVGREPRILLRTTIASSSFGKMVFGTTHLDHQIEEIRVEQVNEINRLLSPTTSSVPLILAGDFNAVPESAPMQVMASQWLDAAHGTAAPTIPATNPRRRIDYIFCAPSEKWTTTQSTVLEEPIASDHRPVVTTLQLAR